MASITINTDCRHYRSDHPCLLHKQLAYACEGCSAYDPIRARILIIKLDAMGDVLRTTSLLKPLHESIPGAHVTWITRPESTGVLKPNAMIDQVVPLDSEALVLLQTQPFDIVINPDTSFSSSRLAKLARASDKRGFIVDENGQLVPLNEHARRWYEMGQNDDLKKSNTLTYQAMLLSIADLPQTEHPIIWEVADSEAEYAMQFARQNNLRPGQHLIVGLNTGAGGRWRWKKWTVEGYTELIRMLLAEYPGVRVLLYGGPAETERNSVLSAVAPEVLINTGSNNTLRNFGALVGLCDIMITGDTLALHIASALGKPIVALFGPTSAAEIDLYGRGTKIVPQMACIGCYLSDCDVTPSCMQRISAHEVMAEVRNRVNGIAGAAPASGVRDQMDLLGA
jgi:heptosyltransferase-2